MINTPNMYRVTFENADKQLAFQDVSNLANLKVTPSIKTVTPIFIEISKTSLSTEDLIKQVKLDTVSELKKALEIAEKDLNNNLEVFPNV